MTHDFKGALEAISVEPRIKRGDRVLLEIETTEQTVKTIRQALEQSQDAQKLLPCDFKVRYGTFRKGVKIELAQGAVNRLVEYVEKLEEKTQENEAAVRDLAKETLINLNLYNTYCGAIPVCETPITIKHAPAIKRAGGE